MKISIPLFSTLVLLTSFSALADWNGDILCKKPAQSSTQHRLVADAKGRVSVKAGKDAQSIAEVTFSSLRLYSEYGSKKGTVMTKVIAAGMGDGGNDDYYIDAEPTEKSSVLKQIHLDISSVDRGLSKITTAKGNTYEMDCMVRED